MAVVYVNNQPVEIGSDKLNAIQAAQRAGIFVPHYCWHPALTVVASCRMCLVEFGEMKDGKPLMQPRVVPACQTPVKDGSVIVTDSPKAKAAQAGTLESLLLNHPLDCPVCDKAGECKLQDFSYEYGKATSRMIDPKNTPPNKPEISSTITLFTDRCIMCTRCVRFTREISGTAELQVTSRGDHAEIDVFPGEPLENKLAGNVVDLCPVGALGSKDFLYKQRVWFMKQTDSVCAACSTGCSIQVDSNKDVIYRLRPRENPQSQGYFMCDEGRYGYHYVNSTERFRGPLVRDGDKTAPATYKEAVATIRHRFADLAGRTPSAIAAVLSPYLTCEEAYLLAKFMKGLSPDTVLALGPIPIVGEDDRYPKDRKGNPVEPAKFTICAEKCPNRRGVEEILKHFQGRVMPFDEIVNQAGAGTLKAMWFAAGYPPTCGDWLRPDAKSALKKADTLVVQDLFPAPIAGEAHCCLPATSFAEKDGTFVNYAGLAQAIHRAARPRVEMRGEGQVYCDLLDRRGLYVAADVRREMAMDVPYFAAMASGIGELGIRLSG